jgi:hypothetical protein
VPPDSVQLAYSHQLMEHLHPDDAVDQLTAIYRALAPGGRYVCVTPNRLCGPHDISTYFDETPTGFHLREYTSGEMAALFRKVGFARVQVILGWGGHALPGLLPLWPVAWLEAGLERLPRAIRRSAARALLAVRLVATK